MTKLILTVDDSASMRMLLKTSLTAQGFRIESANDGEHGLERIKLRRRWRGGGVHVRMESQNVPWGYRKLRQGRTNRGFTPHSWGASCAEGCASRSPPAGSRAGRG